MAILEQTDIVLLEGGMRRFYAVSENAGSVGETLVYLNDRYPGTPFSISQFSVEIIEINPTTKWVEKWEKTKGYSLWWGRDLSAESAKNPEDVSS